MAPEFDRLDLTILRLLVEQPRAGVREYARQLGIARGTAQARIDKLQRAGVIESYAPQISPAGLGFSGRAYIHIHLAQGQLDQTSRLLAAIPEVIAADSIAGEGDLICQVVAKDNNELERVIQRIIGTPGVVRTRTEIVLSRRIPLRVGPLIDALARELS
ncbi:Lrp/AsnC family transcriptional regulator [Hoyosella sp. YIM 151337]|uniref:Lrp/AsnC family transcriptional regulator n=1 Tax=Hoyosella sp. YIM 151337 TaxID=2992742 RepID=UPI0022367F93|nr:Lrp/AsnC family transcriptional regulator [Hoyosella sp. YIM 151337]MCW4355774.1 Lrp/AsnC family transcriptional regulator [Hoyosella sp. YIM 151337]